jgi:hypothetical protein
MLKTSKRLAASAGVIALAATGLTVGVAASADAATCYGGAVGFKKQALAKTAPTSGWFKTTSRCGDINVKIAQIPNNLLYRNVKVCFENGGCQSTFKRARVNQWTVIATNVKDGTNFRLSFDTPEVVVGQYAS